MQEALLKDYSADVANASIGAEDSAHIYLAIEYLKSMRHLLNRDFHESVDFYASKSANSKSVSFTNPANDGNMRYDKW